jgi:protein-ribulosamine 3-kinase
MLLPEDIKTKLKNYLYSQGLSSAGISGAASVSGGSINQTFKISSDTKHFFLKYNDAALYPGMFGKEAAGLSLLRQAGVIDTPDVLLFDETQSHAFLLLGFIDSATEKPDFWEDFGKRLAGLHSKKARLFGLEHDNFMGSLHQHNAFHDDWTEFFITERLGRQVRLAREAGAIGKQDVVAFDRLYRRLQDIFSPTEPSLVHGDLWSGNFLVNSHGQACLIDPAVYYGHPEVDIAMSTLFGGFSNRFYEAYNNHYPMEKGWQQRLDYYNLYPLMVHVNLFGGGYLNSVQRILRKF